MAIKVAAPLLVLLSLTVGSARATTLTDQTFDNLSGILLAESGGSGSYGVASTNAAPAGGVGSSVAFSYQTPAVFGYGGTVGVVDNALVYDPAVHGAFASLDVSIGRYVESNLAMVDAGLSAVIRQNGNFYLATINPAAIQSSQWLTYSVTLSQMAFTRFDFATGRSDPTKHPDFSSGVMSFGIAAMVGTIDDVGRILFDDLIVTTSTATVPEAPAIMLVAGGLATLALAGWVRARPVRPARVLATDGRRARRPSSPRRPGRP